MKKMNINDELFYQMFHCHNAVMLLIETETGLIREANKSAIDFYGYSHEELLNISIKEINQLTEEEITEKMQDALSQNQNVFIFPHKLANGEIRQVQVISSPLKINDEKLLFTIVHDVTEEKLKEIKLRENEEKFRRITENASDAIYRMKFPEGIYEYMSPASTKIFGYTPEEFYNSNKLIKKIIHPDWEKYFEFNWNELLQGNLPSIYEYQIIDKTDTVKWISQRNVPIFDEEKNLIAIEGIVSDITELKLREEEKLKLKEQEKLAAVGKIAGKMAHDFNNILGIILGTSELLQLRDLPEDVLEEIEIIIESSLKGSDLSRELLYFAKDRELAITEFNLNEKINHLLGTLKLELSGIEVKTEFENETERIYADPGLLENALMNMIKNSVDATCKNQSPLLVIRTGSKNDSVLIEIEDNGCGIPEKVHDRIYEPMFSMKGKRDLQNFYDKSITGNGYGMANVKRCVEHHNGTIEFVSTVGKGTKFEILFPVMNDEISEIDIENINNGEIIRNKKLLIVEDEVYLGNILNRFMKEFDHEITVVNNGKDALEKIRNNSFDLISLDFLLPDKNGFEIYKEIRADDKFIPVIFISGNFEFIESMIDLKKNDNYVDYLAKPFKNTRYLNIINKWLIKKDSQFRLP